MQGYRWDIEPKGNSWMESRNLEELSLPVEARVAQDNYAGRVLIYSGVLFASLSCSSF